MLRYAITPGKLTRAQGAEAQALVDSVAGLARDGVACVLLREKRLGAREMVALARAMVRAVAGRGVNVVVPGRADVALASGAQGVHLSGAAGELRVAEVRRVCGGRAVWVSVACHSVEEVARAREDGADAVLFAPVFGKWVGGVEVVRGVGLEGLGAACEVAGRMPVFALGGIDAGNAAECVAVGSGAGAGARGVAGIRMFFGGQGL